MVRHLLLLWNPPLFWIALFLSPILEAAQNDNHIEEHGYEAYNPSQFQDLPKWGEHFSEEDLHLQTDDETPSLQHSVVAHPPAPLPQPRAQPAPRSAEQPTRSRSSRTQRASQTRTRASPSPSHPAVVVPQQRTQRNHGNISGEPLLGGDFDAPASEIDTDEEIQEAILRSIKENQKENAMPNEWANNNDSAEENAQLTDKDTIGSSDSEKKIQQAILLSLEENEKRNDTDAKLQMAIMQSIEDKKRISMLDELALNQLETEFIDEQLTILAVKISEAELIHNALTKLIKKEPKVELIKKINDLCQQLVHQEWAKFEFRNPTTAENAGQVLCLMMFAALLAPSMPKNENQIKLFAKHKLHKLCKDSKKSVLNAYDNWKKNYDKLIKKNGAESGQAAGNGRANASSSSSITQKEGTTQKTSTRPSANVSSQKTPNRELKAECNRAVENRRIESFTKKQSTQTFLARPAQFEESQNENTETNHNNSDDSGENFGQKFDRGAREYYAQISHSGNRRRSNNKVRTNSRTTSSSNVVVCRMSYLSHLSYFWAFPKNQVPEISSSPWQKVRKSEMQRRVLNQFETREQQQQQTQKLEENGDSGRD